MLSTRDSQLPLAYGDHPRAPGVAAADHATTSPQYHWRISAKLLFSSQPMKPFMIVVLTLRAMFRMQMGHYIGIPTSRVSVFKLGRTSALLHRESTTDVPNLFSKPIQFMDTLRRSLPTSQPTFCTRPASNLVFAKHCVRPICTT